MIVVVIHATIKISASSFMALLLLLVKVIKDGECVLTVRKFLSVHPTIDTGCMDSALFAYSPNEGHR